jgi:hypothetical protein
MRIAETLVQRGDAISPDMAELFKYVVASANLNRRFLRGRSFVLFVSHGKKYLESNPELYVKIGEACRDMIERNFGQINMAHYVNQRADLIEQSMYAMIAL